MVRAFAGSIRRFLFLPVFILLTARGRAVPAVAAPQADIHARTGTEEGSVEMEGPLGLAVLGAAIIGDKKLPGRVRFGLGASALLFGLSACAPLGPQTVEPGVTIVSTEAAPAAEVQGGGVGTVPTLATAEPAAAPTEVPTLEPTVMPTEIPLPTATPEPTETPDPVAAEAQKVVEYVEANSVVINQVPMDRITLRATHKLQSAVSSGLPPEERHFENPLFAIVTDVERLEALLNTMSIEVVGHEGMVSLGDTSAVERIEFVFMSGNEEPGFRLPTNYGHSAVTETQFGAYKSGNTVYVVMKLGDYLSTEGSFNRSDGEEVQFFIDGVISGLRLLTKSQIDISTFTNQFLYDSSYDNYHPGLMENRTWLIHMVALRPVRIESGDLYANSGFYKDYEDWVPLEFRPIIEALNW